MAKQLCRAPGLAPLTSDPNVDRFLWRLIYAADSARDRGLRVTAVRIHPDDLDTIAAAVHSAVPSAPPTRVELWGIPVIRDETRKVRISANLTLPPAGRRRSHAVSQVAHPQCRTGHAASTGPSSTSAGSPSSSSTTAATQTLSGCGSTYRAGVSRSAASDDE